MRTWYGRKILESGHASLQRKDSFRRNLFGDAELSNALARLEIAAASHVEANQFDVALQLIHVQAFEIWQRTQKKAGYPVASNLIGSVCQSEVKYAVSGNADAQLPCMVDFATST